MTTTFKGIDRATNSWWVNASNAAGTTYTTLVPPMTRAQIDALHKEMIYNISKNLFGEDKRKTLSEMIEEATLEYETGL